MGTTSIHSRYLITRYRGLLASVLHPRGLGTLFILCLMAALPARSQDTDRRAGWFLTGSAGFSQLAENNIDRLINKGPSISGTITRQFGNDRILQELKASLGVVVSKTSYESKYKSPTPNLTFQYTVLTERPASNATWQLGGFARMDIQDSYYPKLDQGRYYWANFTGIGVHAGYRRPVNDRADIDVALELPVAGFISRPESERFFRIDELNIKNLFKRNFSNLKAASVNRILNPTLDISMVLQQGWVDRIGYQLNYLSMKHPAAGDFERVDHRLFIRIKL